MSDIAHEPPPGGERALSPDEFRDVIGRFASGVTVITTISEGERFGSTASAVSSLSLEPPMLLICMNRSSSTGQAISRSHGFAVNVLGEQQRDFAAHFARKDPRKFEGVPMLEGPCGMPLLRDALAHVECRVVEEATGGTHTVFLAEVQSATAQDGPPLAYFRGQFGYLEPALDDDAYQLVSEWLRARREQWGQPLDVTELARELDLSPGSLYHALGQLASDGVVQAMSDGGYIVTPMTPDVIAEYFDARHAILLGVVELTVGHASVDDVARLRMALEGPKQALGNYEKIPLQTLAAADDAFHEAMLELVGSAPLIQAYRRLTAYRHVAFAEDVLAATQATLTDRDLPKAFAEDHEDLVTAYERGDVTLAREALERHTSHAKAILRGAVPTAPPTDS